MPCKSLCLDVYFGLNRAGRAPMPRLRRTNAAPRLAALPMPLAVLASDKGRCPHALRLIGAHALDGHGAGDAIAVAIDHHDLVAPIALRDEKVAVLLEFIVH